MDQETIDKISDMAKCLIDQICEQELDIADVMAEMKKQTLAASKLIIEQRSGDIRKLQAMRNRLLSKL
ncbi:MAG TPA: hypothetical protein VN038_01365 [Dyadobacter sp.]|nr:hypothetical protein [Dyadobacter sp.]